MRLRIFSIYVGSLSYLCTKNETMASLDVDTQLVKKRATSNYDRC